MSTNSFRFTRLTDGKKQRIGTLREAIGVAREAKETWLFLSPHDDDLAIGAGLWMQAAVKEGIDVQVLVVTDGRMGYCTLEQRDQIADIRRKETYASFKLLGIGSATHSCITCGARARCVCSFRRSPICIPIIRS